ncbi:MAG TPA: aspartate 1-decarboxylase [Candidatus Eisenbacteria bacterium]|uniref:Aspartate 1-decarboxylase n=1 Tax=Eiseniibacteriota bacterium TaxID=2212470 RepID=A0A7V2ATN1_UNCEI|nr:aspartate 1-decarboxylase [Candidatus Eisenbacteria bacterium]
MKRFLLKSMILRATVTQADLRYVGSITIDEDLMDRADLSEHENVHVVDRTNGHRLQTYVIKGERGSGVIGMNGAAAHLVNEGDEIDIMAYGWSSGEARPVLIEVDSKNTFRRFAG